MAVALPAVPAEPDPLECATYPPCGGIRPGGLLSIKGAYFGVTSDFSYCSMAFIVTDGTDLYVSTAGHCVEDSLGVPSLGERVSAYGVPGTFGTVVYQWCEGQAVNGGCAAGTDFGLIKIDADKHAYVDPTMPAWGAADGGLFTAHDSVPRQIQHFGWGVGIGDVGGVAGVPTGNPATQARTGLLLDASQVNYALVETAAISGDSGSGVLVMPVGSNLASDASPQALGVLTHISVGGLGFVQRLDRSLEKAGDEMGTSFTLVTEL